MRQTLTNLLLIFAAFLFIFSKGYCETGLRDYKAISLVKGSFLKAISLREISTSTVKAGDIEYFINPEDVYIGETNVIPKNSVYIAQIESVTEAVEGVHAAMKIKIIKLKTTKDVEYNMDAYVWWKGSTTVGGDLAQSEYYARMPHYTTSMPKGVLQLVPTSIRHFGEPRAIKAGEEVTFIMNKNIPLYGN